MTRPALGALQIAALLISSSFGIGFLFGSGEMALSHGLGGSLYGLATAFGMFGLALLAPRLWSTGQAIWDLLAREDADDIRRLIAALSLVWMSGVLAAQLQGCVAVLAQLGAAPVLAWALTLALVLITARLSLQRASTVFASCLMATAVILVGALTLTADTALQPLNLVRLATDVTSLSAMSGVTTLVAIVVLVLTGSDYHQFLLAGRSPSSAFWGCVLAGVALTVISPMPALLVLAAQQSPNWPSAFDPRQAIPVAFGTVFGAGAWTVVALGVVATAALGCAAAITRAMGSAVDGLLQRSVGSSPAAVHRHTRLGDGMRTGLILAPAAALGIWGPGVVAGMVAVNVIYIAAIAWPLLAWIVGRVLSTRAIRRALVGGSTLAAIASVTSSLVFPELRDTAALLVGLSASALAVGRDRVAVRRAQPPAAPAPVGLEPERPA